MGLDRYRVYLNQVESYELAERSLLFVVETADGGFLGE
jgi:hypothetical protein